MSKYTVENREYKIECKPAPSFGDYEAMNFFIETPGEPQKQFRFFFKMSRTLVAILKGRYNLSEQNFYKIIENFFLERYVKPILEKGQEEDRKFEFKSTDQIIFEEFIISAVEQDIFSAESFENQEWKVLKYLYNAHYELFNKDDTPVSLRIISEELKLNNRRAKDILEALEENKEVELIEIGTNIFARITSKGIKKIEKR